MQVRPPNSSDDIWQLAFSSVCFFFYVCDVSFFLVSLFVKLIIIRIILYQPFFFAVCTKIVISSTRLLLQPVLV